MGGMEEFQLGFVGVDMDCTAEVVTHVSSSYSSFSRFPKHNN